jgi:hypothetical protein
LGAPHIDQPQDEVEAQMACPVSNMSNEMINERLTTRAHPSRAAGGRREQDALRKRELKKHEKA